MLDGSYRVTVYYYIYKNRKKLGTIGTTDRNHPFRLLQLTLFLFIVLLGIGWAI